MPNPSLEAIFPGLTAAVMAKRVDGMFFPFDAGRFEIPQWGDFPAIEYPSPKGWLIFRHDAWINYGYSEEDDFRRAIMKGCLFSKTAAGAFSLGMSINSKDRRYQVSIFPHGFYWKTTCLCLNEDEAAEVKQLALSIGAAKATVSNNTVSYFFGAMIPNLLVNISNIPAAFRPFLVILITNAAVAIITLIVAFFYHVPAWMPGLFGLSFCYFLLVAKKRYEENKHF